MSSWVIEWKRSHVWRNVIVVLLNVFERCVFCLVWQNFILIFTFISLCAAKNEKLNLKTSFEVLFGTVKNLWAWLWRYIRPWRSYVKGKMAATWCSAACWRWSVCTELFVVLKQRETLRDGDQHKSGLVSKQQEMTHCKQSLLFNCSTFAVEIVRCLPSSWKYSVISTLIYYTERFSVGQVVHSLTLTSLKVHKWHKMFCICIKNTMVATNTKK